VDALKSRNHRYLAALLETLDQLLAIDPDDMCRRVRTVGINWNLPALPGAGRHAHALQNDRKQPGGNLLARRDHGVVFTRVVQERRLAAPGNELIRSARHRGHDDGNVMPRLPLTFHVTGDVTDVFDIGDGCAAELHDQPGHWARVLG